MSSIHQTDVLRTSYDVAIVGAGHNGLIAAAYLAKAGKRVVVIESKGGPGGAAISARLFPEFDASISRYAYLISLVPERILSELGIRIATRQRQIASYTPYRDPGGKSCGLVFSNVDPTVSRDSVVSLTGLNSAWDRYQLFQAMQNSLASLIWPTILEPLRSKQEFRSAMTTNTQRRAWRSFVERPLGEAIEEYMDHDVLRGLVLTDGKIGVFTHPHDESLLQNRCFLYHTIGGGTGEWRVPIGGMGQFTQSLASVCLKHGVHFRFNSVAESIVQERAGYDLTFAATSPDMSHGEECETRQAVHASHILVNATPSRFAKLFGRTHQRKNTDEGSVVKMNFLLRRLPRLRDPATPARLAFTGSFHLDEGYQQMQLSYQQAATGGVPSMPPSEVYCHSLTDPSILSDDLCERGFHTLTLFGLDAPYRVFEKDNERVREEFAAAYFRSLDQWCDEPFEECVARSSNGSLCYEVKSPVDLEHEVGLDFGNIFHDQPSWFFAEDATHVGRWGVETDFPNVFNCGSSALRGGAVSGIPGHNAAMAVLGL